METTTVRKAFGFRLYPNANQTRELEVMLETHRRLYNTCLELRKGAYEKEGTSLGYCAQCVWFAKECSINKWFGKINAQSAQATMRRLDHTFQAFFRHVKAKQKPGYPRFKPPGRFDSFTFPTYGNGIKLIGGKLYVQHVGTVKVKLHRAIEGTIKTVTLKTENDKWYVIFSCNLGQVVVPQSTNPPVGIDMGLESFLTTSDGQHEPNPRYLKKELPALRRAGRAVSRKKKGGTNRRKAVKELHTIYAKVKNLRHDHRHKVSLNLVRRYGLVAVESLNITQMVKNRRLSRAITDAAWSSFLVTLKHKAVSASVPVVEVDARGTSQMCSECRCLVPKKLSERVHRCPHCGLVLHRDVNAARNILAKALLAGAQPVGANVHLSHVAQEATC